MIITIYNGILQPFEFFHCFPDTSEEELHLFMKRAARHPHQYLLLEVNNLPFKLQEVYTHLISYFLPYMKCIGTAYREEIVNMIAVRKFMLVW